MRRPDPPGPTRDFFEVVRRRRSIRAFRPDAIPDEALREILEAVRLVPTAGNLQAYEVVLVRDPARRRRLARAALDQLFIASAPLVLVVCANAPRSGLHYGARGRDLYCLNDASIAATYVHLAAEALGLGSVWVGAFDEREVASIIGAPDDLRPIAILPIGRPDESPGARSRRSLDDIVHEETFGSGPPGPPTKP